MRRIALIASIASLAALAASGPAQAAGWNPPAELLGPGTGGNGNPLAGAEFSVDEQWGLANRARLQCSTQRCYDLMSLIADQPETKRFGSWTANPRAAIDAYLDRILDDQPGTVPLLATYRLQHPHCRGFGDSPDEVERYQRWYDGFAAGIGKRPAVIFLEIDGLITAHCLNSRGQVTRYRELVYAMRKLTELPRTVVYLDAGSADAAPYREMARRLIKSGVMRGQGFFLNSTHYNWTTSELAYGQRIARLLPQVRHFVVSTAANGQGPLRPKNRVRDGNEVRCNPPKRGLGPKPTANTGYLWADAFVWIGNPGRSAGHCKPGDPGVGVFHAPIALGLAQYANFTVTGPKTDRPTRR